MTFFILGMPRSRTLWFSKLFTDDGFPCIHEHFSRHKETNLIPGVYGYSDTNPLTSPDYGDYPVLIIERDFDQVCDSIFNAFDKPRAITDWKRCIKGYMRVYKDELSKIRPKNCLRIKFEDINNRLIEIWKFLLPDVPYDEKYLSARKERIIKTENRDLESSLIETFGSIENLSSLYDSKIEIHRITDYAVVQFLINECWDEISEDGATYYMPDIVKEYWVGMYINEDELIGCYRLHQINLATWQGHAFMLKGYRKEYSKLGCRKTLQWLLDNTDCQKLIATVPMMYENVMKFLEGIGFHTEGVNRQSYTKRGKLWDVVQYGLTREEIEELL